MVVDKSEFTFNKLENMMASGRNDGGSSALARRAVILAPSGGIEDDGAAGGCSVYVALARKEFKSLSEGSNGR